MREERSRRRWHWLLLVPLLGLLVPPIYNHIDPTLIGIPFFYRATTPAVPATTASCPRCGSVAPSAAARCGECGFVFVELPAPRSLPRPSPALVVVALLVLAGAVAAVVLLTRDSPPQPPAPVPAARAEARLARQLDASPAASVRCTGPIRFGRSTRCQFIYPDGDTQLMLVTLSRRGELDVDVPYPAQRRPGR
jgi:Protein of unknown function (DUF3311)